VTQDPRAPTSPRRLKEPTLGSLGLVEEFWAIDFAFRHSMHDVPGRTRRATRNLTADDLRAFAADFRTQAIWAEEWSEEYDPSRGSGTQAKRTGAGRFTLPAPVRRSPRGWNRASQPEPDIAGRCHEPPSMVVSVPSDLDEEMVRLALSEREALWPTTLRAHRAKEPTWASDAEEVVRQVGRTDYLAPHGFKSKVRKREAASPNGNLLWLDLDPPKDMPLSAVGRWLESRIEGTKSRLPLYSIRSSSGRGQWLFWKLSGLIPKEEVNRLNRLLSRLGGGDPGSWGCERWVRMPGSLNEKTGVTSACIEINTDLHDPETLASAIDRAAVEAGINLAAPVAGAIEATPLGIGSVVPEITVPDPVLRYIESSPSKKQAEAMGIDRSTLDQSLVARLVNAGASDESIKAWFEYHLPARYEEERDCGRGDYYLRLCIRSAREGLKRFSSSASNVCIPGDDPFSDPAPVRRHVRVEPEQVLVVVRKHQGLPKKQVEAEICEALGCSPSTGKRRLNQLAKVKSPFVEFRAIDGRTKAVYLTERGEEFFKPRKTKFKTELPVGFLRANPSRREKKKPPLQTTAKAAQPRDPSKPLSREARLRRITNQLRYHQIEDMPRFSWRGQKRSYYLQILDYIERIETTGRKVYDQIMLPGDHHVGDLTYHRFRTFISHDWHDEDGQEIPDPLQSIDPEVYWPRSRFLATAVIVEPKGSDFEVATWNILDEQTGEQITEPAVGWIIEDLTFFGTIMNDPNSYEDRVFKTVRHGTKGTRRFVHTPTEVSLNLDEYRDRIDREAYLQKWADRDQLRAVAASLSPGWTPWPQAQPSHYRRSTR
jgi:DNA-binding MarR family transcriptional regulator